MDEYFDPSDDEIEELISEEEKEKENVFFQNFESHIKKNPKVFLKTFCNEIESDYYNAFGEISNYYLVLFIRYSNEILSSIGKQDIELLRSNFLKIWGVDINIFNIENIEKKKIVFLLGAGASAIQPTNIPIVSELLDNLWNRSVKIDNKELNRLKIFCKKNQINNIEDILTATYISDFTSKNNNISRLISYYYGITNDYNDDRSEQSKRRNEYEASQQLKPNISFKVSSIQDTLQTLFSLLTSTMIDAEPNIVHKTIADFVSCGFTASIITTNYDLCIDKAFQEKNIKTNIIFDQEYDEKYVKLIKMHGSVNWAICDSCQKIKYYDIKLIQESYTNDTIGFPIQSICRVCGGIRKPMLIPPLYYKFMLFPSLIELWYNAQKALYDSDIIIVIGYSFSDADPYILKTISKVMAENNSTVLIISDITRKIGDKLKLKFKSEIKDFDEDRIIYATGSSDAVLTPILNKWIDIKKKTL